MAGKAIGALFNQKTVENSVKGFTFPADLVNRHQKLQEWIASLKSGKPQRWVVAVARRLNGEGFLITAYQTDAIKEGVVLWPR